MKDVANGKSPLVNDQREVRIPVRLNGETWVAMDGSPLKIKAGSLGDLQLRLKDIEDPALVAKLTQKQRVLLFPQSTELRVALSVRSDQLSEAEQEALLPINDAKYPPTTKIASGSRFVSIKLGGPTNRQRKAKITKGGLWLNRIGLAPGNFETGEVSLPSIPGLKTAESLNNALTQLSEVFEAWRLSHTGSIYEKVFYRAEDGTWHPLSELRYTIVPTESHS